MRNILVANNSDLLKFFDFEFSTPPASVSEAMRVTYATQHHQQIMTSLITSLVSHFDAEKNSSDDYRSCRLIQVFCHKYSFVFFYIIVILLEVINCKSSKKKYK